MIARVCSTLVQLVIYADLNKQTKTFLKAPGLDAFIVTVHYAENCLWDLLLWNITENCIINFASDTSSAVFEEKSKLFANKANSWHYCKRTELQNEREKQLSSFDEKFVSSFWDHFRLLTAHFGIFLYQKLLRSLVKLRLVWDYRLLLSG